MAVDHGFSVREIQDATGLEPEAIEAAIRTLPTGVAPATAASGELLKVLPYPGGRHPRLGFLEGAVDPRRETKLSVFTPWQPHGYVVVDLPEAIWSNLGLTYLAHTHLDTVWTRQGIRLPPLEWSRRADGAFASERRLPNGITFGVRARPHPAYVEFRWWVFNGTDKTLTGLRAQACVLTGWAPGFAETNSANKRLDEPFAAVRDPSGRRWIITAWESPDRVWQNPRVPCIHSDPRLPDCPPGAIRETRGWLWFYEGDNVLGELARLRRDFLLTPPPPATRPEPVPDRLVVLTFDDSVASHHSTVRPLLKELGFGATFFITEGFSFRTNKADYLTWEQIAELHRDGFEIGNHTMSHMGVTAATLGRLKREVEFINDRCIEHGIPKPVSFAYPGNAIHPAALPLLRELGFRWARRGAQPEFPYETGRGVAYDPREDHPLLLPTTGDARPDWSLDNLRRAVAPARDGHIAVLQFHGVPDREHPWVNTPPERFREYLKWLKDNGYRGIAVRDLQRWIDPDDFPQDPWAVIERRRAAPPPP